MKIVTLASIAFSLFVLPITASNSFAGQAGALAIFSKGEASYSSFTSPKINSVTKGAVFQVGDKIITGAGGKIAIEFDTGAIVTLEENTELTIASLNRSDSGSVAIVFDINKGYVKSTFRKRSASDVIQYRTRAAVAAVMHAPPHIIKTGFTKDGKARTEIYLLGAESGDSAMAVRGRDPEETEVIMTPREGTSALEGMPPALPFSLTSAMLDALEKNQPVIAEAVPEPRPAPEQKAEPEKVKRAEPEKKVAAAPPSKKPAVKKTTPVKKKRAAVKKKTTAPPAKVSTAKKAEPEKVKRAEPEKKVAAAPPVKKPEAKKAAPKKAKSVGAKISSKKTATAKKTEKPEPAKTDKDEKKSGISAMTLVAVAGGAAVLGVAASGGSGGGSTTSSDGHSDGDDDFDDRRSYCSSYSALSCQTDSWTTEGFQGFCCPSHSPVGAIVNRTGERSPVCFESFAQRDSECAKDDVSCEYVDCR